jgi:alkaline phosphatase D
MRRCSRTGRISSFIAAIKREIKLPNGQLWNNIVTEEKSKPAETLAEFRGNYKYNLLDWNLRAFNAEIPTFALWDDHEVTNDWCPDVMPYGRGKSGISILELVARGGRAFHEFMPMRETPAEAGRVYRKIPYGPLLDVFMLDMRSYRGSNVKRLTHYGPDAYLLGPTQTAWLKRQLVNSSATWKVIAADLPIGVINTDAIGQGDGEPRGRETEIADLLAFIKRAGVQDILWITADAHYTAANYYDPNKAVFQDFEPFWEFISGPIHAGTWPAGNLDNTFGPRAIYQKGCSKEQGENLAPCFGLQFFGHIAIDGATEVMTVTLKDFYNRSLWSMQFEPSPQPWPTRFQLFTADQ